MAFCSNCGAQLEGDGRFCVKCGSEVGKAAAAPAASAPATLPSGVAPHLPAQPFAVPPVPPGMPGPIPIVMGAPPHAPAKSHGWLWGVIIVFGILYGLYYIGTHNQPSQNPGQTPAPQTQPGTPGPQAQNPGAPGPQAQPGAFPQPQPGYPGQQPGYPQQPGGQGNPNQALVQAQQFAGRWDNVNGTIQVSQAQWRNGANVSLQAATLECGQFAQTGQMITHMQTTLNGPAQPGQTVTFPTFQMGQLVQGVAKVQCGIVGVTPAQ